MSIPAGPKPVLWPRPTYEANPFHDRVTPRICNWPSPDHRKTVDPQSPSRYRDAFSLGYASPEDESDGEWELNDLLERARRKAKSAAKKEARLRREEARRLAAEKLLPQPAVYYFCGVHPPAAALQAAGHGDSDSGAEGGAHRRAPSPPRQLGSFAHAKAWGEPLPAEADPEAAGFGQVVPWHSPEENREQHQMQEDELDRVRRQYSGRGGPDGEPHQHHHSHNQHPHRGGSHRELALLRLSDGEEEASPGHGHHARRKGANNLRINTPPPPRPPPEPRMPKGYALLRSMASEPASVGGHHRAAPASQPAGLHGSLSARGLHSSASVGGGAGSRGLAGQLSQPALGAAAGLRHSSAGSLLQRRGITSAELNLLAAIKAERSVPGGIGEALSGSPPSHATHPPLPAGIVSSVHLPPLGRTNTQAISSRLSAMALGQGGDSPGRKNGADTSPQRGVQWGADTAQSPTAGGLSPGMHDSELHQTDGLSHRARVTKASTKNIQSLLARSAVTLNKVAAPAVRGSPERSPSRVLSVMPQGVSPVLLSCMSQPCSVPPPSFCRKC